MLDVRGPDEAAGILDLFGSAGARTSPDTPWPEWYAQRIVERLGAAAG